MFGTLVYDEIIIIKKCGLDTNVATEISSRARSISLLKKENPLADTSLIEMEIDKLVASLYKND